MPLDFPNSPSVNQQYTVGSTTWIWDGTVWNAQNAALDFTGYVESLGGTTGAISVGNHVAVTSSVLDWRFNPRKRAAIDSELNALGDLTVANSGTGASTTFNSISNLGDINTLGIASASTGTTSTGRSFVGLASSDQLELGSGEVRIACSAKTLNSLSDGTNRYFLRCGILDNRTSGSVTDGLFFSYTDNVNSGNWSEFSAAGSMTRIT